MLPQTPLHIAVHTNEPAIVKDLVSRGANLDLVDRHGNTPIHVACRKGLLRVLDAISTVANLRSVRAAAEQRNIQGKDGGISMSVDLGRNGEASFHLLCLPIIGLACPHLGVMSSEKGVVRWLHSVGVDMNMQVGVPDNKTVNSITINEGIPPSHFITYTHYNHPQMEYLEHQIVIVFTLGIWQWSNSPALCHREWVSPNSHLSCHRL